MAGASVQRLAGASLRRLEDDTAGGQIGVGAGARRIDSAPGGRRMFSEIAGLSPVIQRLGPIKTEEEARTMRRRVDEPLAGKRSC
jgi:hypothetical protein